ncbi:hypothetical protein F5Y02DRAFT_427122 [Annulohypoxylon stygium]|nr:hypothetical protein F5Y02DRAFT_427122 [Annulohypoxylon stygium]
MDCDVTFENGRNYKGQREDVTIKLAVDILRPKNFTPISEPPVLDCMDEEVTCSNPAAPMSTTNHPLFDAADELAVSPSPNSPGKNGLPPTMNDIFLPPHQPACDIPIDLIDPSLRND